MSEDKYERFGRYLLLDHMVDGGMAKICRARFLGEQADKIVAIKMVQPQFSKDESFAIMFMDEIKVAFGLIHPNIIQTYDYGKKNGQLYVAMEYCDGKNLKEYLDKLKERKFVFPVEISVYIITQVCQGLHYAHTLTDKLTGKSQNIIHRDISPHNIMLTYDGAVKVIDFGIAKAETNSEATQAGTIKGKLSYLAPEYLDGKKLDPRYDEFAVGITLWEMLCSRKLFKAPNDLAVLKKIQDCKVPAPSKINPNVPKELDDIVLKALHKDRTKRFENLDQMNRALMKFLYSNYPDFNATDLNYFAKELFKEDIRLDRDKFIEFGKIDLTPFLNEMKNDGMMGGDTSDEPEAPAPSAPGKAGGESTSTVSKVRAEHELDFGFEESQESTNSSVRIKRPSSAGAATGIRNKKDLLKSGKAKPAGAKKRPAKTGLVKVGEQEAETPGAVDLSVEIQKKRKSRTQMAKDNSSVTVNKKDRTSTRTGVGFQKKKMNLVPVAGVAVLLIAGYFGFQKAPDKIKEMIGMKDVEVRHPAAVKQDDDDIDTFGRLSLTNFDKRRQKLFVNGVQKKVSVLGDVELPFGSNMSVRIETPGREHFVKTISIGQANSLAKMEVPGQLKRAAYGYLGTSGNCIRGKVFFDMFGESRVEPVPSRRKRIAFPLHYENGRILPTEVFVKYKSDSDGIMRKLKFVLEGESDTVDFCNAMYQK